MVKKNSQGLFACEDCGLEYADKGWAEKCEAWCREHHSCNLAITAHSKNRAGKR